MQKQYDLIVYIGRFSPFHTAHKQTLEKAKELAKNTLVIIGSSHSPRTIKNPWTAQERKQMIQMSMDDPSIYFAQVRDFAYDDSQWLVQVGEIVQEMEDVIDNKKIAIIGHDKDHSSFYLNYFPQWDYIEVPAYPTHGETVDATKIRNLLFTGDHAFISSVVTADVYDYIVEFTHSEEFAALKQDWNYVEAYKKSWAAAPFPPTFVTVDAIVVQSGHVLLVQRGQSPGKGMWAMPGGFIDPYEQLADAVIRELREETRLKVPEKVLKGSVKVKEVFADPARSSRGRTITHAYLFHLDDAEKLPRVKGGDDAAVARWFPLSEFRSLEPVMFEDHFHIVNHMINKL